MGAVTDKGKTKYSAYIGQTFGRYTVESAYVAKRGNARFKCVCSCGNRTDVPAPAVIKGQARSCGCLRDEENREKYGRHRRSRTPIYKTWQSMKERCHNPTCHAYPLYGGRGITVCERWRNSFDAFLEDMGERPVGMSIDRIDNNKGYEPSNCRWATVIDQSNNRSTNRFLTIDGVSKTVTEWGRQVGKSRAVIKERLKRGWSERDAVFEPLKNGKG